MSVFHRSCTATPWIRAWPNPARRRVVRSGAFRYVSLYDGSEREARAVARLACSLGGALPVLSSAGRAQPCRRRGNSVSTLVTDVSI